MDKKGINVLWRWVGLFITIFVSFIFISSFEFRYQPYYDKPMDFIRVMIPSLLFTLYIIISYSRHIRWDFIFIYPLFYFIGINLSIFFWGVTTPIVGYIGGVLTNVVVESERKNKERYKFGILGLISSLIGLVLFGILRDRLTIGTGFGIIIGFWQLFVGFGLIIALNKKPTENNVGNIET